MTQGRFFRARIGAAAALATCAILPSACGVSPDDEAAVIERSILATPGQEELWRTIKQEYPKGFSELVSEIEALDPDMRSDANAVARIGASWLQDFFQEISPDAVRAPPAQMLQWSSAEAALYTALQSSALSECAGMTMGDWITIDPSNTQATSAISRRNAAMVRAASAGRQDPQDYSEPSEDAFGQLGDAIAATGLAPEWQSALGSTEEMQALSPEQQCTIGVAVYQAVSDLPDDVEPAIAAYMLAPE